MKEMLIVLNKDEGTVCYVDANSGRVVKTVQVDKNPHEVVIAAGGRYSYVTNSGGNSLSVLDNKRMAEERRVTHPEFKFPHGLGLSKDEATLWIASTYANKLFLLDTKEWMVRKSIATHQQLVHMISFSPDGARAFVPNIGSNNITIVDVQAEEVITHLPTGKGPEGVAVHPGNNKLYVANQHDDILEIFDLQTLERSARLRLGRCPVRLVFSPDQRYAFIPNREGDCVSVVDTEREWEIKRIPTGIWPGGVVFDSAGKRAWVANNKTNDISVIDVGTLKETGRIDVGIHPDGVGYFSI